MSNQQPVTLRSAAVVLLSAVFLLGATPLAALEPAADGAGSSSRPLASERAARSDLTPHKAEYLRNVYRVTGRLTALSGLRGIASLRTQREIRLGVSSARIQFSALLDEQGFEQKRAELLERGLRLERIVIYRPQTITDPDYVSGEQWDLEASDRTSNPAGLSVEAAWDISTGEGAVVAVLDTGFLPNHPDFVGLHILPGYDFVSAYDNDATPGRDSDPTDPGDGIDDAALAHDVAQAACGDEGYSAPSSWHGTHVAGTIVAQVNGSGIVGIAPDASLIPVRVLGQCGGSDEDIADAIRWSAGLEVDGVPDNDYPADVINLSLGGWGPDCDTVMGDAITDARAAGTITVVAAGNESDDARNFSPASCTDAVTPARRYEPLTEELRRNVFLVALSIAAHAPLSASPPVTTRTLQLYHWYP